MTVCGVVFKTRARSRGVSSDVSANSGGWDAFLITPPNLPIFRRLAKHLPKKLPGFWGKLKAAFLGCFGEGFGCGPVSPRREFGGAFGNGSTLSVPMLPVNPRHDVSKHCCLLRFEFVTYRKAHDRLPR